jgi:Mce-associated membrane protein
MNATPEPSPPRRRLVLLLVAGLLAAVILAAVSSWNWHQAHERGQLRAEALRHARALAVQVTSYDYRDVDAYFDLLKGVSTGDFAKRYAQATDDLREVMVDTQSEVTSKVIAAGVTSLHGDRAEVVLFVDQTVHNKTLTEPRIDRNRVELTVVRDGDDWLISKLDLR